MDVVVLESLVAVVECGSIAEAARRLNLTPAAVAQRLRVLESELGHPLVARAGRTVQPTAAGLAVTQHARPLIRGMRDLRSIAADDMPSGRLRIGATATALTGQVPALIAALHGRFPQIDYYLRPGASVDLYHLVLSGDLDAALLMQPPFVVPKSLGWETLRREPLVLLAPADLDTADVHRLLREQPFIRYDRNQWGGQLVTRYLARHRIAVSEWLELDALDSIAAMVDRGLGVAIVPDWAPPWPAGLTFRKIPLPHDEARCMGVLWQRSGSRNAAILALVDTCRQLQPDLEHEAFRPYLRIPSGETR